MAHNSRSVPADGRTTRLLVDAELERELDRLTDNHVDELLVPELPHEGACRADVVGQPSRLSQ